jgi:hypothetical protein
MRLCRAWKRSASVRTLIAAGLLLAFDACVRDEASDKEPSPAVLASTGPAPIAAVKTATATPVQPASRQSLEDFQKTLERRFDRRQIVKHESSEGVLYIPNGFAAHAVVAVKNPDGTVSQQCLSSAVEARAVANQIREGAGQ